MIFAASAAATAVAAAAAAVSAGFALGFVLWHARPNLASWRPPPALIALAAASGVGALLAPGAPTGLLVVDAALKVVLGIGAVVLGARAEGRAVLIATAVAGLAALGSVLGWAVWAAFGFSVATVLVVRRAPLAAGLAAAVVVQGVLRLETGRSAAFEAGVGLLALAPLLLAGVRHLEGRTRRRVRSTGAAVGAVTLVALLLGLAAAVQALPNMRAGLRETNEALAAAQGGDSARASQGLAVAARQLAAADEVLSAWWARPALGVPVAGRQLGAARAMASTGSALALAGADVLEEADVAGIPITDGRVPLERIAGLEAPLIRSLETLEEARNRLDAASSPWLLPPVRNRFDELEGRVDERRNQAETAVLASRIAPGLLGGEAPRRFFLAIQNPAELRATGGIVGNFGEITATEGQLRLTRFGRAMDLNLGGDQAKRELDAPAEYISRYRSFHPEEVWQNLNASPDFPTVARVIAGLYPQSGGQPVDGVISVDPAGLAALLQVVGPVEVDGWPEPITAANAEQILLHDQYVRYPTIERVDFLSDTAQTIWSRLTTGSLPGLGGIASALGPAAQANHFLLWSPRPGEQRLFERLGVSGAVPPVSSDALAVVTQNAGGNKIDWFLQRSVDYQATVEQSTGGINATLDIRLRNDAPAQGLPPLVISSSGRAKTEPGQNRLYLSIYSPWELAGAEIDGRPVALQSQLELGRRVYSTFLTVPPGATSHVRLQLSGRLPPLTPYHLDLFEQVTVRPDIVSTTLETT